jgi:hypothetical protein
MRWHLSWNISIPFSTLPKLADMVMLLGEGDEISGVYFVKEGKQSYISLLTLISKYLKSLCVLFILPFEGSWKRMEK